MTHARPIPDAAKAPWPAHPAPIERTPAAAPEPEPAATPAADNARTMRRIGVGAAIGSAAVAAALLYVNHGRRK